MPRAFKRSPEAERLLQAFDMYDTGIAIMRQNLKRKFPRESAAAIEKRLNTWLTERPGDAEGKPVDIHARLARRFGAPLKRSRKI